MLIHAGLVGRIEPKRRSRRDRFRAPKQAQPSALHVRQTSLWSLTVFVTRVCHQAAPTLGYFLTKYAFCLGLGNAARGMSREQDNAATRLIEGWRPAMEWLGGHSEGERGRRA